MKTEQVKQVTDHALEQLMTALEQGKSTTLSRYLAAMARFHRYSFHNIMLIYTQMENASRIAGFHTWRKLGRFVRKGEKGILILAPMVFKRTAEVAAENDDDKIVRFKAAYVFDVTQTDGEPLPELDSVHGDPAEFGGRLREFIAAQKIVLEFSDSIAPALGISSGGKITVLPNLSPADEFATLVHELAHEMLHHIPGEQRASKTVRETQAEAVSAVVCQAIGLEAGTAASDYIQLYSGDKDTLAASLQLIQQTATTILAGIQPQAEPQPD